MRFADLVILGWIPFSLVFFALLRPRHAVLAAYLGAWLFLPMKAGLPIKFLPDLDKVTAASTAVLLGVMLFDASRLFTFRFRWFDLPVLAFCFASFLTSINNGLGAWDGMSAMVEQVYLFGIPYFIGRIYFNDWEGFRDLAIGIFVGGLVYVPLCLFEIKMSPQLHHIVYGYHQHGFAQTYRFGGFRPMVFMQHGLAVGFWMTAASLVGIWLMVTGSLRSIWGVPMIVAVPVLVMTTILCKSAAGIGFLFMGLAVLFAVKWTKTAIPLYLMIAFSPAYMILRTTGIVTGDWAVQTATEVFGADRAQSLAYRMEAENIYAAHALERPFFGYGRWDPSKPGRPAWMVFDEDTGKSESLVDGMWLLTFSISGLVGLVTLTTTILLPPLLLRKRVPPQWWAHPMAAPAAACAVLLTLHMADNLLNAMINPMFICAIGGLAGLGARVTQPRGFPVQQAMSRRPIQPPPPMRMPQPAQIGR